MIRSRAVMATIPGRGTLGEALRSIRPQVDECYVILNGHAEVPAVVRDLDCHVIHHPENRGAEEKLRYTADFDGLYCTVDDDIWYHPEYVAFLRDEVARWPKALVSLHGRRFPELFAGWSHPEGWAQYYRPTRGGWANHLGTGVMAYDSSTFCLPETWAHQNAADAQLALLAQTERIPMWVPPHDGSLAKPLSATTQDSIHHAARMNQFVDRSALLATQASWWVQPGRPLPHRRGVVLAPPGPASPPTVRHSRRHLQRGHYGTRQ